MKKFTAHAMRRKTEAINRRSYRREVIGMYKGIIQEIKWYAKQGHGYVSFRAFDFHINDVKFHAFRLFAFKNPDFRVRWDLEFESFSEKKDVSGMVHCPCDNDINRVTVTISW